MLRRLRMRPRVGLAFDHFEPRLVLSASPTWLTIPLDPTFDQFGAQVETIQAYGDPSQATFGIFDTGASVVTVSAEDRGALDSNGGSIPVKVPGGAIADGIGGAVIGDVSEPGTIWADGIHASNLSFDDYGFPYFDVSFGPDSAQTPGIQVFLGTDSGSPGLPTITGTPVLNPSPAHPSGLAALIDLQGFQLDFSDLFPGLVLAQPDLHFVSPETTLSATAETTAPVRLPIHFVGADNHANPGDLITESYNPVVQDVSLVGPGGIIGQQSFLFDTGSQLTILSTAEALALGLDLAHPDSVITVQGVGGTEDVPGFTLDSLSIPLADGGSLQFTNVPIYVLDAAPGVVDGIFGMNLLNTATQALYNPFDPAGPSLSLTFDTSPDRGLEGGFSLFSLLSSSPSSNSPPGAGSANSIAGETADGALPARATTPDSVRPFVVVISSSTELRGGSVSIVSPSSPARGAEGSSTPLDPSPGSRARLPAQSMPTGDRPVSRPDDRLVLAFEDAKLDELSEGAAPALFTTPAAGTLPSGEVPTEVPPLVLVPASACDLCLADDDWSAPLPDLASSASSDLVESASLSLVPATGLGLAVVLGGHWVPPTLRIDHSRRRSPIRLVLQEADLKA